MLVIIVVTVVVATDLDKLDGVLKRKRRHSEVEEESLTLSDYIKRKREEYDSDGKTSKKRVFIRNVLLLCPSYCVSVGALGRP